jgi:hypothetical protein
MSVAYIKPISIEAAANGASAKTTVSAASTVRVVNTATTAGLVSVCDAADAVVGTFTLAGGESVLIPKNPAHKVFGGAATLLFSSVTAPR